MLISLVLIRSSPTNSFRHLKLKCYAKSFHFVRSRQYPQRNTSLSHMPSASRARQTRPSMVKSCSFQPVIDLVSMQPLADCLKVTPAPTMQAPQSKVYAMLQALHLKTFLSTRSTTSTRPRPMAQQARLYGNYRSALTPTETSRMCLQG